MTECYQKRCKLVKAQNCGNQRGDFTRENADFGGISKRTQRIVENSDHYHDFSSVSGNKFHLKGIELQALFPAIDEYMTYEGSLPFPSCAETVTWIILNRSIQISSAEVSVYFL